MASRIKDSALILTGTIGVLCFCIFIRVLRSGFDAIWDLISWL